MTQEPPEQSPFALPATPRAARTAFDQVVEDMMEALRANGGEPCPAAALDWLARHLKQPENARAPRREPPTAFDRTVEDMMEAARENGGVPVSWDASFLAKQMGET